jgi:hypothetical protein
MRDSSATRYWELVRTGRERRFERVHPPPVGEEATLSLKGILFSGERIEKPPRMIPGR